jgi:hypothetical protein
VGDDGRKRGSLSMGPTGKRETRIGSCERRGSLVGERRKSAVRSCGRRESRVAIGKGVDERRQRAKARRLKKENVRKIAIRHKDD